MVKWHRPSLLRQREVEVVCEAIAEDDVLHGRASRLERLGKGQFLQRIAIPLARKTTLQTVSKGQMTIHIRYARVLVRTLESETRTALFGYRI